MKRISYALSIFILFIAFIINGEGYQLYLSEVETQFPYTTFKLPEDTSQEEMIEHIIQVTEEFDVKVFVSVYTSLENEKSLKTFYANEDTKKILGEEYNIKEGKYPGILEGTLEIKFTDFSEVPDVSLIDEYYFIGNMDDIAEAYNKLSKVYDGSQPIEGYEMFDSNYYTVAVWIIAGIVIFVLQLSAVLMNKKESMLKVTFGERKVILILRETLQDLAFFIVAIFITYWLAAKYTCADFNIELTIFVLSLILIINTVLNITIPFGDYKKVFSNISVSKNMLRLGYMLKIVSSVLVTIIISLCIVFVAEGIKEQKQKEFFERYKDYYYVYFRYRNTLESDGTYGKSIEVREEFYRKYFNEFDAVQFSWWDKEGIDGKSDEYVYANKNILWHLKENINEIEDYELKKEIYFIVPTGTENDVINEMKFSVTDIEGKNFEYEYEIIYYEKSINLLVLDDKSISGAVTLKNPFIIYNNIDASEATHEIGESWGKATVDGLSMYKIDKDKVDTFIEEYGLKNHLCTITNVWEDYQGNWEKVKQTMILCVILMVLFVVLETFVIKNILKLEYTANAVELSVKKVLGYGVFEKNKTLILTTAVTSIICIILAAIVATNLKLAATAYILSGGLILVVVEMFVIFLTITRFEKNSVQKILKGGAL